MLNLSLPSPEEVRRQRKERARAATRRDHYLARVHAAPTRRQALAEAVDYLRATLARRPEKDTDRAIEKVFQIADEAGEIR